MQIARSIHNKGFVAEINAGKGHHTIQLTKIFKHVYCIDPWISENVFVSFVETTHRLTNIRTMIMSSKEASEEISPKSLDFVFLNLAPNTHYFDDDINIWLEKLIPGGQIGGSGALVVRQGHHIPRIVCEDGTWIL